MDTRQTPSLRRRLLHKGQSLLQVSGLADLVPKGGGATVLMYHSVPGPDVAPHVDPAWQMSPQQFSEQMEFLATHRNVVALSELVGDLRAGQRPAPGTVAITFDDGYRDNLEQAAPMLARHDLPALMYVPTGYIRRGQVQWVDRLYTAMTTATRTELAYPDNPSIRFDLANNAQWHDAYGRFGGLLIRVDLERREQVLQNVEQQLQPATEVPGDMTLDWDGVRQLVADYPGWEIGVHTVDHMDMSALGLERARAELVGSMDEVEKELGVRPRHMSFPYGRSTAETRALAQEVGLISAVASSDEAVCTETSERFCLPRVNPLVSDNQFRFWTGGSAASLPRRLAKKP